MHMYLFKNGVKNGAKNCAKTTADHAKSFLAARKICGLSLRIFVFARLRENCAKKTCWGAKNPCFGGGSGAGGTGSSVTLPSLSVYPSVYMHYTSAKNRGSKKKSTYAVETTDCMKFKHPCK